MGKRKKGKKPALNSVFYNKVKEVQSRAEKDGLSSVQRGELYYNMLLNSTNLGRGPLQTRLGVSFDGERDVYESAGYKKELDFDDYYARFRRGDIATTIVSFYPEETWRMFPVITDGQNDGTISEFERRITDLKRSLHLQEYFKRVDTLAGVGEFAVLFLGFNDGKEFFEPVESATDLLYVNPYKQNNVTILSYITDKTNPLFGTPEIYEIQMRNGSGGTSAVRVHSSRIIHVAEKPEECDYIGTPRLETVYNRLQDIETIVAGGSEMFWKGGFTGTIYEIDKDFEIGNEDLDKIQASISDFEHDLKRYLLMKGVTGKQLPPSVESPKDHINVELDLIASATRIPKRVLIGSEEGKLAGEQDSKHIVDRVNTRRVTYATSSIVRPFIDRLISVGVIPHPLNGSYDVLWEDIDLASKKEKVYMGQAITESLVKYVDKGVDALIPPMDYLTKVLTFSKEEAESMLNSRLGDYMKEETDVGDTLDTPPVSDDTTEDLDAVAGTVDDKLGKI